MDKPDCDKETSAVVHRKNEMDRLSPDIQKEKKPVGVAETGVLIRKTSIRVRLVITLSYLYQWFKYVRTIRTPIA